MKFSIKDFYSKCDQIRRKLPICSHLVKKSLMENFIFCVAQVFEIPFIDKSISELELRFTKLSHSASRFLFLIPTVITKVPLDKDVYQQIIKMCGKDLPNQNVVDIERKWLECNE